MERQTVSLNRSGAKQLADRQRLFSTEQKFKH